MYTRAVGAGVSSRPTGNVLPGAPQLEAPQRPSSDHCRVHEPAVGKTSRAQPDRRDGRPGLAIADTMLTGDGRSSTGLPENRREGRQ
jgi:hypothetical protein